MKLYVSKGLQRHVVHTGYMSQNRTTQTHTYCRHLIYSSYVSKSFKVGDYQCFVKWESQVTVVVTGVGGDRQERGWAQCLMVSILARAPRRRRRKHLSQGQVIINHYLSRGSAAGQPLYWSTTPGQSCLPCSLIHHSMCLKQCFDVFVCAFYTPLK